jgi:predicted protein tyrosine phosphatase
LTLPDHPSFPADPKVWWRRLCPVTPQISLCGDLHENRRLAAQQLDGWMASGVTHILDVRGEYTDRPWVAKHAPHLVYHWVGADDHGGRQDPEWFDAGVMLARESLQDPAAHIVVHCHMGINRGPSMALAVMLAQGWDVIEALDAIRTARPVAAVIYAADAAAWWHARRGSPTATAAADQARVRGWFGQQQISLATVARLIRAVERTDEAWGQPAA